MTNNGNEDIEDANLKRLSVAQAAFGSMLDSYKGSVVHGSLTLDEWYYHFAGDVDSTTNRQDRNET